jgi:hypothetical protein
MLSTVAAMLTWLVVPALPMWLVRFVLIVSNRAGGLFRSVRWVLAMVARRLPALPAPCRDAFYDMTGGLVWAALVAMVMTWLLNILLFFLLRFPAMVGGESDGDDPAHAGVPPWFRAAFAAMRGEVLHGDGHRFMCLFERTICHHWPQ